MSQARQAFLDNLKKTKASVSIYLTNGIKLQGLIQDFDESVILLNRDGHIQMIERTSTSTIVPPASAK